MIAVTDLVCLPYTPDLTEAGIRYACRALPHLHDRARGQAYDRLRRIVAATAIELAFRRYLVQQDIPFGVKAAALFTDPDRFDVTLGGRRCLIQSFLISHRNQSEALLSNPALLLDAPAIVPLDQQAAQDYAPTDLYVFAFLAAQTAPYEHPACWVHAMPAGWVRPVAWSPLGMLKFKSELDQELTLELGGQDRLREPITYRLKLPPREPVEVDAGMYSLGYLRASIRPGKRLGIYSASRHETYLIQSADWGDISVGGTRIDIAGWITRDEFRQRATLVPVGSRVFQFDRTRTRNLSVPIASLRPLPELLERLRERSASQSHVAGSSIV